MKNITLWLFIIASCFGYYPVTTSFNSGQISPLMEARSDFQKYNSSCRTLENMLVLAQGPATKRPGTKYIASTKHHRSKARLIPFEYATDDTYILELGNFYMRFYRDGGQILSAGVPYEITTPFSEDEIFTVQYAQSNNVMYLVDGTDPPQKLTRSGHTNWTMANAVIDNGPFQLQNLTATTITPSATTGTITLTASSTIFYPEHVNSYWEINQKRGTSTTSGSLAGDGNSSTSAYFTGGYSFTTSGTWVGKVTLQRSEDGTNWDSALAPLVDTNFDNPAETEEDGAYYRVNMSSFTSGTCKYVFTIHDELNHGVVKITGYTNGTTVTAQVVTDLDSTSATNRWREGYWSDYRGWPRTVAFHQQRLIFGGSETFPQTLWFGESNPDDYEDFDDDTLDTSAFIVALQGQNPIQWMESQDILVLGTSGSIGIYGTSGEAITPTSPAYQENTKNAAGPFMAISVGNEIIYIERGSKKVREMVYSIYADKYVSPELSILAEDITKPGIRDLAFQNRPNPVLWCVLKDGDIATMTFYKEQEVVAWSEQTTQGDFESVAVIPSDDEDEVWVIVKRIVGGAEVRYVEQFQPYDWGEDDDLAYFVDCGLSYSGPSASTFTGLSHLAGESVDVLGDGVLLSDETVSGTGSIIIDNQVQKLVTGLSYTAKLETMPIVIDPQDKGMTKKINDVAFDFYKTGKCRYGNGPNSDLTDILFYENATITAEQELHTSVTTFKWVKFPYGPKKKQTIYVESPYPMPLTIRSIVFDMEAVP